MALSISSFLDVVRFNPTTGGTTDWTVSSAVNGYQTPALGGAVNLATYRYRAESADLTQWEVGYGVYTVSTTVLTRATVLYNSSGTGTGTGQSGAGTKINFSTTPQVAVVALAEDLGGSDTTWTPSDQSGAALTFTSVTAIYSKVGNIVTAHFRLTFPSTASASLVSIGGLPIATSPTGPAGAVANGVCATTAASPNAFVSTFSSGNTTVFGLFNSTGGQPTNAALTTATIFGTIIYLA
jgi:hypothetical protein